jgi:ketosteroid isomerase-like protein
MEHESRAVAPVSRASEQRGVAPQPLQDPPAAREVVERFLAAFEEGDFEAARRCLGEERFAYLGPTRAFERADAYLADLAHMRLILKRLEVRRVFSDGDDVCVIFDFHSTLADLAHNRVAEWFTVAGGRIVRIEVFLDASPYNRLFEV